MLLTCAAMAFFCLSAHRSYAGPIMNRCMTSSLEVSDSPTIRRPVTCTMPSSVAVAAGSRPADKRLRKEPVFAGQQAQFSIAYRLCRNSPLPEGRWPSSACIRQSANSLSSRRRYPSPTDAGRKVARDGQSAVGDRTVAVAAVRSSRSRAIWPSIVALDRIQVMPAADPKYMGESGTRASWRPRARRCQPPSAVL